MIEKHIEIKYLKNYIELQRLRVDEEAKIDFEVKGKIKDQKIAPLLLMPLVENGFKYGIKGDTENAYIDIILQIDGPEFQFSVENNKGALDEIEPKTYGGVGLKNVKRTLELLYPGKHQLNIEDHKNSFRVDLKLELSA